MEVSRRMNLKIHTVGMVVWVAMTSGMEAMEIKDLGSSSSSNSNNNNNKRILALAGTTRLAAAEWGKPVDSLTHK